MKITVNLGRVRWSEVFAESLTDWREMSGCDSVQDAREDAGEDMIVEVKDAVLATLDLYYLQADKVTVKVE